MFKTHGTSVHSNNANFELYLYLFYQWAMSVLEERQNTHYIIISIYSLVYLSAWTIKVNTLVQPFSHQITVTYSPGQKVCRESPGHLQPPWPQPADELQQKGDCLNFRMSKEFLPPASRMVLERTEAMIANLFQRFYCPLGNNAVFSWVSGH